MKLSKFFAVAAIGFSAVLMCNAEVIPMNADFLRNAWTNSLKCDGNQITVSGRSFLVSRKPIDIDHAKKYSFKITAVGNKVKPTNIYVGFDFCDENGKGIAAHHLQGLQYTITPLARDAKKGDTKIYISKGAAWVRGGSVCIVKDAKADNSDVPNAKVVGENVTAVKKVGTEWEVTLAKGLTEDLPANTSLRQHLKGGYYYCVANKSIPAEGEITLQGSVSGLPKYLQQYNAKNWPIGAKKAYFIILADWGNTKTPVILKDGTFTIE